MNWAGIGAALIPCRNEAETIGAVVRAVRRHLPLVLVVDDGSDDSTAAAAGAAGAQVMQNPCCGGKGLALRAGWKALHQRGFRWVLTLDGDGQHSPDDIPALLEYAEQTSADLIVGNRMPRSERMPWLRRSVNRWMSRRLSNCAGRPLPDSQCGFRLINLDLLTALPIRTEHFEIESEVLLAFARAGRRIEFVPIQVIYRNEQSKIHPLRDAVRWCRWWWSVAAVDRPAVQRTSLGWRLRC